MIRQSLLIRYLVTTGIFLLIDAAWLGLIAPKLYKANIGHLMAEKPNFLAAGVFYLEPVHTKIASMIMAK